MPMARSKTANARAAPRLCCLIPLIRYSTLDAGRVLRVLPSGGDVLASPDLPLEAGILNSSIPARSLAGADRSSSISNSRRCFRLFKSTRSEEHTSELQSRGHLV